MVDQKCVDTLRMLSVDMIAKANSGHPGLPLGAAPAVYALYRDHLKFHPKNPDWENRDRFILSAGHGSALLYSTLHLFGYDLSMEDLKEFRQTHSRTPGHPEYGHTPGVEATTGPLGQGLAMGVGMALAEAHLAATFNTEDYKIVDHHTYVLVGDGCLMEGISHEAASFAGSHQLHRLIVLYDSNKITIEGDTDLTFHDDTRKRFESYGWDTQLVEDGTDIDGISEAIARAKQSDKPSFIEIRTVIGYKAGSVEGLAASHGAPLKEDDYAALKSNLGWTEEPFTVPEDVKAHIATIVKEKEAMYAEDMAKMDGYRAAHSSKYDAYHHSMTMNTEDCDLSTYFGEKKEDATRSSGGRALQEVAQKYPYLLGGSADLGPSNNSEIKGSPFMSAGQFEGRNIHFGVREFAMAAITNGMALHGGVKPYCATFFVFSDYMKPAMRLSALMDLPVIYIFTHDSIGVGEDGPTHEPIEQLAMLRSMPNMSVIRPADFDETLVAWEVALKNKKPTALVLTRQKLPTLGIDAKKLHKGAYIAAKEEREAKAILIATGSEVSLAMEAKEQLKAKGIDVRVVSMPSWDLFEEQSESYKQEVLPKEIGLRISVEALGTMGWEKYTLGGPSIGMHTFGLSGKGSDLFKEFKITAEEIVRQVEEQL
ncbi:MAG: transketolase [Tissierellia bacterium]|nr:transketolase [Tissierellia bacterium]